MEKLFYNYILQIKTNWLYYTCTVTTDEDRLLPQTRMPKEWDEENPFYRYEDIGIFFSHNVGLIMD